MEQFVDFAENFAVVEIRSVFRHDDQRQADPVSGVDQALIDFFKYTAYVIDYHGGVADFPNIFQKLTLFFAVILDCGKRRDQKISIFIDFVIFSEGQIHIHDFEDGSVIHDIGQSFFSGNNSSVAQRRKLQAV